MTLSPYMVGLRGLFLALCLLPRVADAAVVEIRANDVIWFSGVMVRGDSEQIASALKQVSPKSTAPNVWMDSRGGDVDEAMALGRLFRKYKASLHYRYCASSCLYAFLGGAQRYASLDGSSRLVVHRPEMGDVYVATHSAGSGRMMNMFKEYTVEMLGNDGFYNLMMSVPFANPRAMSLQELRQLGIVTAHD